MTTRFLRCMLGALLVAPPAYTQPSHRQDAEPLRIVIETIPHSQQRYATVGDWRFRPDGLHIAVSKMSGRRYEFLIAMHETIECQHAGVSQRAVDSFDMAYEKHRKPGDDSEPGDDPRAPYHRQHMFASKVERMLAHELAVNWAAYNRQVSSK